MTIRPDIQIGDVLAGKYEVVGVIGHGGMGVVLEAVHRGLNRPVALKVLRNDILHTEELTVRFDREARAAAQLRSRHAVSIADVEYTDDGAPFMVMERLRGRDLEEELVRTGRLEVGVAVTYILQACTAMSEAHALGIVHRDLKPQNLFVTKAGDQHIIKVLDFGISKVADESSKNITQTASALGTPLYMSPEQIRSSKHVNQRTDIWSLGVILYEVLTGRPPFDAESPTAIVAAITADEPVPLCVQRPDVPKALSDVVMKALAKRQVDRYGDIEEFAEALAPFGDPGAFVPHTPDSIEPIDRSSAAEARRSKSQTTSSWETAPFKRSSRATKLIGLAAIAVVALGLAWVLLPTRDESSPVPEESSPAAATAPMETGVHSAAPPAPSLVTTTTSSSAPAATPRSSAAVRATAAAKATAAPRPDPKPATPPEPHAPPSRL